jgi:hypothetical protein
MNPGVGMSGQVLVHPSHICQIGESDQGLSLGRRSQEPYSIVSAQALIRHPSSQHDITPTWARAPNDAPPAEEE